MKGKEGEKICQKKLHTHTHTHTHESIKFYLIHLSTPG